MQSFQIIEHGKPLERRDYDTPEPQGGEVLLKVTSCGVCHSDIHIWDGYFDLGNEVKISMEARMSLPFTMGHEVLGQVIAVGPDVTGVAIGDSRIVYPWIGCGACAVCARGEDLLCLAPRTVGTRQPGGYSDHVLVPEAKYLVPYDGISEEVACTYACSGITAYSALNKLKRAGEGDWILTLGAGGVGLNAVMMFAGVSKAKLVVADVDAGKRQLALDAGAHAVIDNGSEAGLAELMQLTDGGALGVVDFVGAPQTAEFAMAAARRGGKIIIVGLYGGGIHLPLPNMPLRMLTIAGSYVGTLEDLKEVVALAQAGKIKPLPVTSRPLAEVPEIIQELKDGKVQGRVILKP